MKTLYLLAKGNTRQEILKDMPFAENSEIWGVNDVGSFEEFKDIKLSRIFTFDPRSPEWLNKARVAPIWSWQPYRDNEYPLNDVIKHFSDGVFECRYFTNTISYMLALAVYENFERIYLYGVDAPYGGIYFMEKSGLEYWIGRAQQAGIEVITCKGSLMLQTYDGLLYGARGATSIDMYLSDRMYLMNILPRQGDYETMYVVSLAKWLLALKVTEKDEHEVTVHSDPQGNTIYQPKKEFLAKIHFPYWVITYLRNQLKVIERANKLPAHMVSIYGMLCGLSDPEPDSIYTKNIRCSFVLATKNREKFLDKAFENIGQLKTQDDELIVVDGNSTDATPEIIQANRGMIDNLIVGDDKNAAHALNKGYMAARGKYVKQICDDDIIDPNEMNRSIAFMEQNPDIELLVCGGLKETPQGRIQTQGPTGKFTVDDIFRYGSCGTGFVHTRESFAKYGLLNTDYVPIDREFALRLIGQGGNVRFLPGKHYLHGVHAGSTSITGLEKWNADNLKLITKYKPNLVGMA